MVRRYRFGCIERTSTPLFWNLCIFRMIPVPKPIAGGRRRSVQPRYDQSVNPASDVRSKTCDCANEDLGIPGV